MRVGYDLTVRRADDYQPEAFREGVCQVVRVVDGDTLIVRQQAQDPDAPQPDGTYQARLRLLGIDTPETVKPNHPVEPWGPEATAFTEQFVKQGQVRLQLDRRRTDRYGRLLAYVYVNDRLLNEELVRAGLARVSVHPGDSQSMARRLRKAEQQARQAQLGIWSQAP